MARLTSREKEVLNVLFQGFTYAQACRCLKISRGTINSHIRSIYIKLEAHTLAGAIYEALLIGELQLPRNNKGGMT